jgi:uncharacterized integral membrane protein
MRKVLKVIFFTLLFILGITLAMENASWVVLRYYFGLESPPVPLFLIVLFAILLGVCLAGVGFFLDERALKKSLQEQERKIAEMESELAAFRNREQAEAKDRETANLPEGGINA